MFFDTYQATERTLAELEWPEWKDYVNALMAAEEPKCLIDSIEAVLGLPPTRPVLPPITRSALQFLDPCQSAQECHPALYQGTALERVGSFSGFGRPGSLLLWDDDVVRI